MRNRTKLIYGVGVNDWTGNVNIGGKEIWQYQLWTLMLERCFSEKKKQKCPSYADVTCSDDWLVMSKFINDITAIENYEKCIADKWQLDKDILFKGNKFYSKENCCFVPREINNLFVKSNRSRGGLPIGLVFHKSVGKIQAQLNRGGTKVHLGYFTDKDEAFHAYKKGKEEHVKEVAEKWKGVIADNVYQAMMRYEVNIND